MEQFDDILADATAAIESGFFKLPIYGGPPVYRERVYCYELYHQMRLRWPSPAICDFVLNGEVDKSAHAVLEELGVDGEKPDLLVHRPGYMRENFAIIEVKHIEAAARNPRKDLDTLALFKSRVGYTRAIYLIYGDEADERIVQRVLQAVPQEGNPVTGIEIWLHPGARQPSYQTVSLR